MLTLGKPRIIERGPYLVVGAYATFEGDDEGPGWSGASQAFYARRDAITNQVGDEGDACFALSHEDTPRPPYVEYVYIKIEERE